MLMLSERHFRGHSFTRRCLVQESNANSVAWNSQFEEEEVLAFTGGGSLCVKAGNFATHQQQLQVSGAVAVAD